MSKQQPLWLWNGAKSYNSPNSHLLHGICTGGDFFIQLIWLNYVKDLIYRLLLSQAVSATRLHFTCLSSTDAPHLFFFSIMLQTADSSWRNATNMKYFSLKLGEVILGSLIIGKEMCSQVLKHYINNTVRQQWHTHTHNYKTIKKKIQL